MCTGNHAQVSVAGHYNLRMARRNTIHHNSHMGVLLREKGAVLEGKDEKVSCLIEK